MSAVAEAKPATAYETLALYIDGKFIEAEGRKTEAVLNPATGEVLAQLPHATREDLDRALAAAHRAFTTWSRSSPLELNRYDSVGWKCRLTRAPRSKRWTPVSCATRGAMAVAA